MNMLASIQKIFEPLLPGLLGIELSEVGPERVVASMQVRSDLCTTGEVLHGGAIMAFADTLGAVATFANLPEGARTTTIESKTNFLGAAPAGTRVTGECTPFHRGRTTMVWQTLVKTEAASCARWSRRRRWCLPAPAGAAALKPARPAPPATPLRRRARFLNNYFCDIQAPPGSVGQWYLPVLARLRARRASSGSGLWWCTCIASRKRDTRL